MILATTAVSVRLSLSARAERQDRDRAAALQNLDGLFADAQEIDLNSVFPRNATSGRVAYATTYVINTVPRQLRVQLTLATNNPIRVYVNGQLVAQNVESGGTSSLFTLAPAGSTESQATRVMIKILQRENDARFAFTARLRDELGVSLTDSTREVVFTLGPNGGI